MVAPDRLQLLVDLSDGVVEEYTPDVDESGRVSYPQAESTVGEEATAVLEGLADRNLLYQEFEEKVYICPSCDTEGMQYTTVCPFCESPYAVETELLECRECKTKRPRDEFYEGDQLQCPSCSAALTEDNVYESEGYVCHDCDECSTSPEHRLWCRDCDRITLLENGTERVLCRYGLNQTGYEWLVSQLEARETIQEALASRGFETRTDERIEAGGETNTIHVYGEDPLLDRSVVVDVHDLTTMEDIERLQTARGGGSAILVTTSGSVDEPIANFARNHGIKILSTGQDGSLRSEYDVSEGSSKPTLIQRFTSAVSQ